LSAADVDEAWRFIWDGDRLQVKEHSAEQALQLLVDYLNAEDAMATEED
jgi:hypothetical protein